MNRVRSWLASALLALVLAAAVSLPWIQAALMNLFCGPARGSATEQLVNAAGAEDRDAMESAIRSGASPDSALQTSVTALMSAAARGDRRVVEFLLARGADPNATDRHGRSAVVYAAMFDHELVLTVLLKHGADPYRRDDDEKSAIDHAAEYGAVIAEQVLRRYRPMQASERVLLNLD
jgi:ankyrin repeat protein